MSREMVLVATIGISIFTWYRGRAKNVTKAMFVLIPMIFIFTSLSMYAIDYILDVRWNQFEVILAVLNIFTFFGTAFINHRRTNELKEQEDKNT